MDAADLGRSEDHPVGPLTLEPIGHRRLVAEVKLSARAGENVNRRTFSLTRLELPADRPPDHPAMARYKDLHQFSAEIGISKPCFFMKA